MLGSDGDDDADDEAQRAFTLTQQLLLLLFQLLFVINLSFLGTENTTHNLRLTHICFHRYKRGFKQVLCDQRSD